MPAENTEHASTAPAKRGGNPAWTPGMRSPNPAGRPPGITDRKAKLAQQMLADADGIVAALVGKALEGDVGAASLILSRCLPAMRSEAARVSFSFDATASVARQIEQVLAATATGAIPPDVARTIIDSIKALSDVRAAEELQTILNELESVAR